MKKTFSILLSLIMVFSLCASGSGAAESAAVTETKVVSTETAEAAAQAPAEGTPTGEMPGNPPNGAPGEGMGTPPSDPPDGNGGPGGGMPGGAPGSGSSADIEYTGAVEISSADSQSGQTYASSTSDESALLISSSDEVSITVTKQQCPEFRDQKGHASRRVSGAFQHLNGNAAQIKGIARGERKS